MNLPLTSELQQRLDAAALTQGSTVSALCQQWILEGLERLDAAQLTHPDEVGRYSVRTGIRTTGPKPLPFQQ